jgi:NAD(P)-dependent dehydrogenase (short-subunit alcohol dehydrogenase family)
LITGATSGIGKAMAIKFAEKEFTTIITGRDEAKGKSSAKEISSLGGNCKFFRVDFSDMKQISDLFEKIRKEYGHLDIACNNAGTDEGATGVFTADIQENNFDLQMDVNLKSVWMCMKYEIKLMQEKGTGSIINISSINGLGGTLGAAAYSASRHGIIGLTKTAAIEYAKTGIRVNVICPGMIDTPMLERVIKGINPENPEAVKSHLEQSIPLGKTGSPRDIAEAAYFLSSENAKYITGHTLIVDGGLTAQFR